MVLGWILPGPDAAGDNAVEVPPEIAQLAQQRWAAKQESNWAEADRLRDELADAGWVIKDSAEGYEVERNRD